MLGIKFGHGDYPKKLGCKAEKIDQWKGLSLTLRVRVNLIKNVPVSIVYLPGQRMYLARALLDEYLRSVFPTIVEKQAEPCQDRGDILHTETIGFFMVNPVVLLFQHSQSLG